MAPSVTRWVREKEQFRRVRRQAYEAARVGKRFGEDDSSHADLALLRALTLERELRRASLVRSRESVAALTRGVIESALRGLYVLAQAEGAPGRLGAEAIGHMRKFSFFGDPLARDAFQSFADAYADEFQRAMPDLRQVAEAVDEHHDYRIFTEQGLGAYLYHDWYLPLSNLSVHPSGAALSRYYSFRASIVLKRPWQVIPRRGAIRVADGAVAFLLAAILESRNEDARWVRTYAERQIAAANIPIVILFLRIALGQGIGTLVRTAYAGWRNRAAFDETAPKERRVQAMRVFLQAANSGHSEHELDEMAATLLDVVDDASKGSPDKRKPSQDVTGGD